MVLSIYAKTKDQLIDRLTDALRRLINRQDENIKTWAIPTEIYRSAINRFPANESAAKVNLQAYFKWRTQAKSLLIKYMGNEHHVVKELDSALGLDMDPSLVDACILAVKGILEALLEEVNQGLIQIKEHGPAVFASFSGTNVDEHLFGVDITLYMQRTDFGNSHSRCISRCDYGSMLYRNGPAPGPQNFFLGEIFGKFFGTFRPWNLVYFFRSPQGDPVQKLDPCHVHSQIRGRGLGVPE